MTIYEFPFPADLPYFQQPWTLDSVQYLFTFRWNTRQSIWFADIADATGTAILSGIALQPSRNLLAQYPTLPLPKGLLMVYDTTGKVAPPGLNSFATTHQLLYVAP